MKALNGGPHFQFTPAISFYVTGETEAEVDRLWKELSEGGSPLMPLDKYDWSEKYGWLKDKFGVSWQVYPTVLHEMLKDSDSDKVARVSEAFLQMKKFVTQKLKKAFERNN